MEENKPSKTVSLTISIDTEELLKFFDQPLLVENMNEEQQETWIIALLEGYGLKRVSSLLAEELGIESLALLIASDLDEQSKKDLVFAIAKL